MHDMQQPHMKRSTNNQVKEGENAVNIPNQKRSIDEIIKDFRRPYVSEMNPQTGDVRVIEKNTNVVNNAMWVLVTFQELHSKAGAKTESIIISMASVRKASPAAIESCTWNFP